MPPRFVKLNFHREPSPLPNGPSANPTIEITDLFTGEPVLPAAPLHEVNNWLNTWRFRYIVGSRAIWTTDA